MQINMKIYYTGRLSESSAVKILILIKPVSALKLIQNKIGRGTPYIHASLKGASS